MKKKHEFLMRKGSYAALSLSVLYAVMALYMFPASFFAGGMGLLMSAIFFRDFQQMREASKEIGKENEKQQEL